MIGHQVALLKREIWEHRSIWITPATVAFIMQFLVIAIVIMIAAFGEEVNPEIERLADATLPEEARRAPLAVVLLVLTIMFPIAMWFLMIFYPYVPHTSSRGNRRSSGTTLLSGT